MGLSREHGLKGTWAQTRVMTGALRPVSATSEGQGPHLEGLSKQNNSPPLPSPPLFLLGPRQASSQTVRTQEAG